VHLVPVRRSDVRLWRAEPVRNAYTGPVQCCILRLRPVCAGEEFEPVRMSQEGFCAGALAQGLTKVALPWRGRGLVPQEHLTDLGTAVARSRFKVGQPVAARVLAADAGARRITLTLKKALVGGKLPPFTSWEVRGRSGEKGGGGGGGGALTQSRIRQHSPRKQ